MQACGDAHLLNFGGFATPERNIVFDINDLDETLPAPWEWDVKRLTASIVIAGQYLRLTESEAAQAARRRCGRIANAWPTTPPCARWRSGTTDRSSIALLHGPAERTAGGAREAAGREGGGKSSPEFVFPKLVEHRGVEPRFKDDPPLIFHPTAELAPGVTTAFREPFARYRASLPDHVRVLLDRYHLCDFAIKVVGIGSVGTMCAVGLLIAADDDPLFLQVKEARKLRCSNRMRARACYQNQGQRVVVRPAPHAVRQRHFPRVDDGREWPRLSTCASSAT